MTTTATAAGLGQNFTLKVPFQWNRRGLGRGVRVFIALITLVGFVALVGVSFTAYRYRQRINHMQTLVEYPARPMAVTTQT
jgi:hypothetical protein